MREIPSLVTLCLRNVGGKSCSAEDTFAKSKDGSISTASKLLRSFYARTGDGGHSDQEESIHSIPISRTPAIGEGSARRKQANDVDLNHPWVAVIDNTSSNGNDDDDEVLVAEYNTPALDVLQCYIDSLVELSRMDDSRLGLHFFQEWKACVQAKLEYNQNGHVQNQENNNNNSNNKSNKKRKVIALGSLSLYNTILQEETVQAMVESQMTEHLAVLDLTGVQPLTDSLLSDIVTRAPHLQRLSVKNCRRLTAASLECLGEHALQLTALDVGGAYNMKPTQVIELVAALPKLVELHASGLLWTDATLQDLSTLRSWRALSLGFLIPNHVSSNGLKQALINQTNSLQSLALPFCEHLVDAALLGVLGRHLPLILCLDLRGNSQLNSLAGWYDGRATIQPTVPPQPLFVLGRYSGISKNAIEDARRIHPVQAMDLTCCLDSDGVGKGIRRYANVTTGTIDE